MLTENDSRKQHYVIKKFNDVKKTSADRLYFIF